MKSTVVIGKGVYAFSLAKVIVLFLPTSHLPFGVLAGSERLVIKDHLATLQKTNNVVLCCSSDTKPSDVATWIRTLRDACVRAEILILAPSDVWAQVLRNAPLLYDRRGAFKMDKGPGLQIAVQNISLCTLILFCHLAKKIPDTKWLKLVGDCALERAQQLYATCEHLDLKTASTQAADRLLRELAAILLGEDLLWESILGLDHEPLPKTFEHALSRLSLAVSASHIDLMEMWDAIREVLTFAKRGEAEA